VKVLTTQKGKNAAIMSGAKNTAISLIWMRAGLDPSNKNIAAAVMLP